MGMLGSLFSSGFIQPVVLLGMFLGAIFRPERIVKRASFSFAVLLMVVSIAIPALLILIADFKSFGTGEGMIIKLLTCISTLATAGAVYFTFDAYGAGHSKS